MLQQPLYLVNNAKFMAAVVFNNKHTLTRGKINVVQLIALCPFICKERKKERKHKTKPVQAEIIRDCGSNLYVGMRVVEMF